MNKLFFAALSFCIYLGATNVNAQNKQECDRLELQYYNFYKNKDYKGACFQIG